MPTSTSAGNPIRMIRPHLEDIPTFIEPKGFSIRLIQADEAEIWNQIVLESEEWLNLSKNLFQQEFSQHLCDLMKRCFFAVNNKGRPVATTTAWFYNLQEIDYGLVHWVAVLPGYQRLGIGKALVCKALKLMRNWHSRAILNTHSKRLPAISLYLDLGFVPDIDQKDTIQDWKEIQKQLQHPAL